MTSTTKTPDQIGLNDAIEMAQNAPAENVNLPMSYVMWLTIRSKFIDHIAAKNITILEEWKQYEMEQIEELQREHLEANPL
ncbi:MAG: hypothetical protein [Arizlama microvirus]|nr:MAG: hypothetical protein [Arizlama microvirus]